MEYKKHIIPLALYQIMRGKYDELQVMKKELEEHLNKNYKPKGDNTSDFESYICDSLYGDEADAEEFIKDLEDGYIKYE